MPSTGSSKARPVLRWQDWRIEPMRFGVRRRRRRPAGAILRWKSFSTPFSRSLCSASLADFEESRGPLASVYIFRHDNVFDTATPALDQCVPQQSRTRCPIGVPDCNRSAIHIQPLVGNSELVTAVQHLDRESFVQFPQSYLFLFDSSAFFLLGFCF